MSAIWTAAFWKATAERVLSTFVLSLFAVFGTAQGFDIHALAWGQILATAALAAGLTLLKCLVAVNIGPKGSPSLVADPAAAQGGPEPEIVLADRDRRLIKRADVQQQVAPKLHDDD